MSDPLSTVDALHAALRGEYAAVFGYGQAAGALSGSDLADARRFLDAHRSRRDRLRALVLDAGSRPADAAAGYDVPPTPDAAAARQALAAIELAVAAVHADLVSGSEGATRELAIAALTDSTVRSARWGGTIPPFPGLTERTPTPTPAPPA